MPDNNDMTSDSTGMATSLPTVASTSDGAAPAVSTADEPAMNVPEPSTEPAMNVPEPSTETAMNVPEPVLREMPAEEIPRVEEPMRDLNDTGMGVGRARLVDDDSLPVEIIRRINESRNVLIALSSNPSVDEMAAAIGLSLYLDRLGKRATAIYSGTTPNALKFLKPEETFERNVDSLQDFVIALNKDKADHLRYKLDGDFVKIYITPYRSRVSESDLDFSYGDYNVDLVIALGVSNGVDLDAALREHGRIMHDAIIINITNGNVGKLAEIEWSDKSASSVSEMIAGMIYDADGMLKDGNGEIKINKDEATAFLTGIVAATDRFSNAETKPETMRVASQLMESGADQQLIAKNITPDAKDKLMTEPEVAVGELSDESEAPELDVRHNEIGGEVDYEIDDGDSDEAKVEMTRGVTIEPSAPEPELPDEMKEAEESLAHAGAETTPEPDGAPLEIESHEVGGMNDAAGMAGSNKAEESDDSYGVLPPPPTPPVNFDSMTPEEDGGLEMPGEVTSAALPNVPGMAYENSPSATSGAASGTGVLSDTLPDVSKYGDVVGPIAPATPVTEPEPTSLGQQPAMQDQIYHPQAADPSAFKIPGV